MTKFDSCLTSLSLRDAVPVDALRAIAAEYEAGGMAPAAAFQRAVEDQLQMAQMEEAGIVKAVSEAWEAQGGVRKVPDLAPAPAPEPVAEATPEPTPAAPPAITMSQEFKTRVLDAAYGSAPRLIERIEGTGMLAAKIKRSGLPIIIFDGKFGRDQFRAALAEVKAAGLEGASKMYVYANLIPYTGGGIDPIRISELPGFGVNNSMRGDPEPETPAQAAPSAEPKLAPVEEAPAPIQAEQDAVADAAPPAAPAEKPKAKPKAPALQARDKKVAEKDAAPKKLKNYSWDSVKLSDAYELPQLEELRQQVMAEHANERTPEGRYLEGGKPTIHLYDKKGRDKLDKLAMAVYYKQKDRDDLRASMPSITNVGTELMKWERETENMESAPLPNGWRAYLYNDSDEGSWTLSIGSISEEGDLDELGAMPEYTGAGAEQRAKAAVPWLLRQLQQKFGKSMSDFKGAANDADQDTRFSLTDTRTIEVDGERRPIRNSLGELVAPDFEGQVAFWKSYTGPVDDQGRPIVEPGDDTRAAEGSIASDIDGQVAQAVRDGITVDKLLALIESESSNADQRELAAALRRQNLKTQIVFGTPGGNYLSGSAEQANGAYRQSDDTAFIGKEVGATQTALHELVHAATLRALQRGGLAAQQIRALHKHVKDMPSFTGYYGITDPEEFITEALTSPAFRRQLADTPAPGAKLSIWQKIVGAVRMLLGMPTTSQNMLERVMAIAPDLFAENRATGPIADAGGVRASAQWASEAFRKWFGKSAVVNERGEPLVVYHGTDADIEKVKGVFWGAANPEFASVFADGLYPAQGEQSSGKNVMSVYMKIENPVDMRGIDIRQWLTKPQLAEHLGVTTEEIDAALAPKTWSMTNPNQAFHLFNFPEYIRMFKRLGYDGVRWEEALNDRGVDVVGKTDTWATFDATQVKSATGNNGDFNGRKADIRASMPDRLAGAIGNGIQAASLQGAWDASKNRLSDFRNVGLQFLGRRQLVDLYASLFKAGAKESTLKRYSDLVQQMDADKNEAGAEADGIADKWGKLKDADKLADLMHDSTLAQIDPTKDYVAGDDKIQHGELQRRLAALSPDAQQLYKDARDAYHKHWMKVRAEIRNRIERAMPESPRRAKLLEKMDATFYEKVKGVYFPLARFGEYVVSVTGKDGARLSVNFAETTNEAEALRKSLLKKFPAAGGFVVSKITKKKEFNPGRDAVSRGFMQELFGVLDQYDDSSELQDDINQLYLQSMPDLSWAKHGIHRKGTPGFSQDARRAFAQNMFHGARYLAKLRYGDRLADFIDEMQDHVDAQAPVADYDSVKAQQVVDEMQKRHEAYMNPKGNQLSNTLTSVGFLFYLGLSPASAVVNLTQTPLVTLPMLAAKYGFAKASGALLAAAKQTAGAKNDISKVLQGDELRAYQQAVDAGVIDVSMAHDLAGIASGDDTKAHAKLRPVMKWASFMFHHGEKFNRQASLLAAYRLARGAGKDHAKAYESAVDEVYKSHFDYSSGNRARVMQGPVARVVLLFRQYGQNMIYTLVRNAALAAKGDKVALRTLSGLLLSHAMAAGVLGLPIVGTLLSAATLIGGDDDEPWDAKVALRNVMADLIGQKPAEVMMHGFSRLTPFDISGRVGLDKLILPDVQEGLEGARAAESWMTAALGPVAGIGISAAKGAAKMAEGNYLRGLEDMMPVSIRNPIKALRLNSEGVRDKSGIPILDDTDAIEEIGQLIGFSPSRSREAMEGKGAVYRAERVLADRRAALVAQWASARMADDAEGTQEVWEQIQRWNEKQPGRRITMPSLVQSLRARNKRIREAEDGVYLPKKHADVRDLGRFAEQD